MRRSSGDTSEASSTQVDGVVDTTLNRTECKTSPSYPLISHVGLDTPNPLAPRAEVKLQMSPSAAAGPWCRTLKRAGAVRSSGLVKIWIWELLHLV